MRSKQHARFPYLAQDNANKESVHQEGLREVFEVEGERQLCEQQQQVDARGDSVAATQQLHATHADNHWRRAVEAKFISFPKNAF